MQQISASTVPRYVETGSLLRGAYYAAEHAYRLLEDAVLLFRSVRYPGALVSSVFSLEEVGRSRIYLSHLSKGDHITPGDLRQECKKHSFKLAQADIPVSVCITGQGEPPTPGSCEELALAERLQALRRRLEADAPNRAILSGSGRYTWTLSMTG